MREFMKCFFTPNIAATHTNLLHYLFNNIRDFLHMSCFEGFLPVSWYAYVYSTFLYESKALVSQKFVCTKLIEWVKDTCFVMYAYLTAIKINEPYICVAFKH